MAMWIALGLLAVLVIAIVAVDTSEWTNALKNLNKQPE